MPRRQENNTNSIKFMCEAASRVWSIKKTKGFNQSTKYSAAKCKLCNVFVFRKKKRIPSVSGCVCRAYFLLGTLLLSCTKTVFEKCGTSVKGKIINSKLFNTEF